MTKPYICVAIRFDDPSPISDSALERAILAALEEHSCQATVAVIPLMRVDGSLCGFTSERAQHLNRAAERGTVEIALHGCSHERRGATPEGSPSEFVGLDFDEQMHLIEQGMNAMNAVFAGRICGFVPPWNSFDGTTMRALQKLSFRYVSAGWDLPRDSEQLVILPRTCQVSDIRTAVAEARSFESLMPIVIAVMHHYDFVESGNQSASIDIARFRELLRWISEQRDVRMVQLGELAASIDRRGWRRGVWRYRKIKLLHWRIRARLPRYCLLTAPIRNMLGM